MIRRRIRYVGECPMPLSDEYPQATLVLMSPTRDDAGGMVNKPIGTAFLVSLPMETSGKWLYLVTAAHVVRQADETVVRLRQRDGNTRDVGIPEWCFHGTADVALAPVHSALLIGTDCRDIPFEHFEDGYSAHQTVVGDVVYFCGVLRGLSAMHDAGVTMVRAGTVGRLDQQNVPVVQRVGGARQTLRYTAHLIDCRAYQGMSGSPCIISFFAKWPHPQGVELGHKHLLLGVMSAHFDEQMQATVNPNDFGLEISVPVHTGVGVVAPIRFLRELLFEEELVEMRREGEDALRRAQLRDETAS